MQAQSRPAASNTQVFACCGLRLRCLQILRRYWAPIVSSFVDPPASKVISLGAADDLGQGLMGLAAPEPNEPSSQTEILRRYYTLKRENKLSELTLSDGEALARLLVEHAIDFANTHPYPCRGIGGSIEMLTVTSKGVEWVQPPSYRIWPLHRPFIAPATPTPTCWAIWTELNGCGDDPGKWDNQFCWRR